MNLTLNELESYAELKEQLDYYKAEEMKARKIIADKVKNIAIKSGTADIGDTKFTVECDEYSVTLKPGINRSIDQDFITINYSAMTDSEKECLSQAWKMSDAKFRKLKDAVESDEYEGERDLLLFEAVTEKPGAPNLDIEIF